MGKLTTHILDTAHGRPAAGVAIRLLRLHGDQRLELRNVRSNDDGRVDAPLLDGVEFVPGQYELEFAVGHYFAEHGVRMPEPRFLEVVTVRFGIADAAAHYHVPLLVSPYGYSTYRGS